MKPARPWRAHAVTLFRNWLELTASAKAAAGTPDQRRQA
jgi:homoserine trans-succinylase